MLPAIVHINASKSSDIEIKGPIVIVLTPYQPPKDDITSIVNPFLDDGNIKILCIYDNEEEKLDEQVEKLKKNG